MPVMVPIGATAPPCETQDSSQNAGAASAPGAGGTVVAAITPGAGTFVVRVTCGTTGGTPVIGDIANMQLNKNAGAFAKLGNPINTVAPMPPLRVTLVAGDTLSIVAIGAATASVIYHAMLTAQRQY